MEWSSSPNHSEEMANGAHKLVPVKLEPELRTSSSSHNHSSNNNNNNNNSTEPKKKEFAVPQDEATLSRISDILQREFDAEISVKSQEIKLIEQRLQQAQVLLDKLCGYVAFKQYSSLGDSNPSTTNSNSSSSSSSNSSSKTTDKSDKRNKHSKPIETELYCRTLDGAFLKLSCPSCKRQKFANITGLINHCRIIHKIKFVDQEEAGRHCGTPVDESLIPADDLSRTRRKLGFVYKRKATDPNTNNTPPAKRLQTLAALQQQQLQQQQQQQQQKPSAADNTTDEIPDYYSASEDGENSEQEFSDSDSEPIYANTPSQNMHRNVSRFYVKKKIIVGNTSKYIKKTLKEADDEATHKWMVYVRGPEKEPDISYFVKKVRFFLDASFAPNHIVEVLEAPFQITRRGWGEFPVRVQLHFHDSRNKPINIIHTLKLDQSKSGLQMLGSETPAEIELDRQWFDENNIPYSLPASLFEPNVDDSWLRSDSEFSAFNFNPDIFNIATTTTTTTSTTATTATASTAALGSSLSGNIETPRAAVDEDVPSTPTVLDASNIDTILTELSLKFPLVISPDTLSNTLGLPTSIVPSSVNLPVPPASFTQTMITWLRKKFCYSIAPSEQVFLDWHIGKRKALEWRRARQIAQYIKQHYQPVNLEISTKFVAIWCRAHGKTPMLESSSFPTPPASPAAPFSPQSTIPPSPMSTPMSPGSLVRIKPENAEASKGSTASSSASTPTSTTTPKRLPLSSSSAPSPTTATGTTKPLSKPGTAPITPGRTVPYSGPPGPPSTARNPPMKQTGNQPPRLPPTPNAQVPTNYTTAPCTLPCCNPPPYHSYPPGPPSSSLSSSPSYPPSYPPQPYPYSSYPPQQQARPRVQQPPSTAQPPTKGTLAAPTIKPQTTQATTATTAAPKVPATHVTPTSSEGSTVPKTPQSTPAQGASTTPSTTATSIQAKPPTTATPATTTTTLTTSPIITTTAIATATLPATSPALPPKPSTTPPAALPPQATIPTPTVSPAAPSPQSDTGSNPGSSVTFYCKYCGCPHQPPEEFEHLQSLCATKLPKSLQDSTSGGKNARFAEWFGKYVNTLATMDNLKIPKQGNSSNANNSNNNNNNNSKKGEEDEEIDIDGDADDDEEAAQDADAFMMMLDTRGETETSDQPPQTSDDFYNSHPAEVQWVNQLVNQHLSSKNSNNNNNNNNSKDGNNNFGPLTGADDDQRAISSTLFQASQFFVKHLVKETFFSFSEQRSSDLPAESRFKMIVPMHVLSAIHSTDKFSFLPQVGQQQQQQPTQQQPPATAKQRQQHSNTSTQKSRSQSSHKPT